MSYPEPVYHGDTGEASAVLRPATTAPDVAEKPDTAIHYLATGAGTDGEFGLYRWESDGSTVAGPAPHFHRTISESFFILSGTMRLYDGRRWRDATAGDFLYVPKGGVHGFRNESGSPASMLLLFTPGAPREEYFETLAGLGTGRLTLTDEERAEFYLRHDNHWV